jgi:hypothetical protein
MKVKDWIISKLRENNNNANLVSKLYSDFCKDFSEPCKKESFIRSVYLYAQENINKKQEEIIPKDSIKEEISDTVYSALVNSTWIKTPEDLISHLNIDTNIWELSKFTRNSWGSETNPSFQVKGEFKKKKIEFNEKLILDSIQSAVSKFKPVLSESKTQNHKSGNMLEISINDHHFGQLSNKSETGESYNIEIAKQLYLQTVDYMLSSSVLYKPEKIVFTIGSDFFNTDNTESTTYAGTYQAESDRWKKTFTDGVELIITAIEKCKKICNSVKVIVVQGNHDYTKSFYLGIALQQRYSVDNSVIIDCSEQPRKYEVWGKNLLCFTHGDKEIKSKLPLIISREQPEAFSKCKFIEIHKGHLHIEKESLVLCNEDVQIKERILPSLVATDDWHNEKGYKHIRESQGYVWNKEHGNITVFKYHV